MQSISLEVSGVGTSRTIHYHTRESSPSKDILHIHLCWGGSREHKANIRSDEGEVEKTKLDNKIYESVL